MHASPQGAILSIGSVNADFQVRVERRPDLSETLLAHDFVRLSGGKAANVAYLARRLEVPARLAARVGDDDLARQALDPLERIGVDLSHVRAVTGESTGVSMITVPPDGKKGIVLAANANLCWGDDGPGDAVHLIQTAPPGSVLVVDHEIPAAIVNRAVEAARGRGLVVILDPSPADRVSSALLEQVDWLVPNPTEAETLTGIRPDCTDTALAAARRLLERGVGRVCMKLGDGGCVLVDRQQAIHIPPGEVSVTDTTGAGDAFAGGLAVGVLEDRSPLEAACLAVACAQLAVTRYGSQPAYPSRAEVREPARRFADHVRGL